MEPAKPETDYKETLFLPKTDFPMKADLARKEPEMVARWDKERLYDQILAARRSAPRWVFHDGPPYANGDIHYGHILNKTLKDIVVKSRTMMGRYVEYKPGWDCHGLPIELQVMKELGQRAAGMPAVEIRHACHAYAMKFVGIQRDGFRRLGVFGTWDAPYLTLDKSYEATVIRQLASFARKGLLYRDQKPVHWCMSCKTALAEAEIEYNDNHVSPSIHVAFPVAGDLYAVIWTTTPWTLPANHAIAYHPEYQYVALRAGGRRFLVAEKLAAEFLKATGLVEESREPFDVKRFEELREARHPFIDRASRFVPATYVTLDTGTGLVHTAPGHGADDYVTGKKFGLPVDAPLDDAGRFTRDFGDVGVAGLNVFAANPKIVEHLHATGALLSPPAARVTHSYPTCWRCKKPVIFRATWQWFASLDRPLGDGAGTLRQVALAEIGRTQWIPPWGENRIRGMIENRPDWVLSRQRIWGVPIPVFYTDGEDGEEIAICDARVMEHVADVVEKEGVDAWFTREAADLVPRSMNAPEPVKLRKGNDIVDVWFESGVSWAAVCEGKSGLDASRGDDPRPVDLYLEGSDQHRGWFHSALLTSAATRGRAPFRAVLTHGFVLDERGRPYSKSEIQKAKAEGIKIEFIPPEEVLKTQGAELLRLWTASADFRNDVAYSRGHLTQLGETYRKLRNTVRFLLGNLTGGYDPDFGAEIAAARDFQGIERYLYVRLRQTTARVIQAYEDYEFHVVVKALGDLCTNDLSALLLDVRKDRLYCDPGDAPLRRETQAILDLAARLIAKLSAPILCFTAEEIWSHLPHREDDPPSVHLEEWGIPPHISDEDDVLRLWEGGTTPDGKPVRGLIGWRKLVQARLEPFRAQKHSSLEARVTLLASAPETLGLDLADLADLFIVSEVVIERSTGEDDARVDLAGGHECARCWKHTPHTPLCTRCAAAVAGK